MQSSLGTCASLDVIRTYVVLVYDDTTLEVEFLTIFPLSFLLELDFLLPFLGNVYVNGETCNSHVHECTIVFRIAD